MDIKADQVEGRVVHQASGLSSHLRQVPRAVAEMLRRSHQFLPESAHSLTNRPQYLCPLMPHNLRLTSPLRHPDILAVAQ